MSTLTQISLAEGAELGATAAKEVAAVREFEAAPVDNQVELGQADDFTGEATFAFSTPVSGSTVKDAPCE